MFRPKVLHKHKKLCFVLLTMMERDHDISPGTLLRTKETLYFKTLSGNVDSNKIVTSVSEHSYLTFTKIEKKSLLMFIDIIYDPYAKAHFLRFLLKDTFVGIRFKKGKTLAVLKRDFDKIDPEIELENA